MLAAYVRFDELVRQLRTLGGDPNEAAATVAAGDGALARPMGERTGVSSHVVSRRASAVSVSASTSAVWKYLGYV